MATTNYEWATPTPGGSAGTWGDELNTLFDLMDVQIKANENAAAAASTAASTAEANSLPLAGGTLTGEVEVKTTRADVASLGSVSGSVAVNLSTANIFNLTPSGSISGFNITNVPASGKAGFLVLQFTNGGAHAITWPSGFWWASGAAPTFKSTGFDVVVAYTTNGGTTWIASHLISRDTS